MDARALWLETLVDSLCLNDPSLNEYGSFLLSEAEAYREAERIRKGGHPRGSMDSKESADSGGKSGKDAESAERRPTDSKTGKTERQGEGFNARAIAPQAENEHPYEPASELDARAFEMAKAFCTTYLPAWAPAMKPAGMARILDEAATIKQMCLDDGRNAAPAGDIHQMLDWIHEFNRGEFNWRKTLRTMAQIREKWNAGRLDGYKPKARQPRQAVTV